VIDQDPRATSYGLSRGLAGTMTNADPSLFKKPSSAHPGNRSRFINSMGPRALSTNSVKKEMIKEAQRLNKQNQSFYLK